ncbi:hypothetical protein CCACVL1_24070 [Corchorus capsularis]|uniref:Uncharacterized protein n=1 Tax=Corchorus capsularis TaxID=210143 RepID=A0A1R3GR20_COCAP|nr:hypothetical protein CCACVL1_24070 [Corchorus capsularis]
METNQKKGFFRGKLAKSLARVTKRQPTTYQQQCGGGSGGGGGSKVSPYPTSNTCFAGQNNQRMCAYYSYTSSKQPITSFHEQRNAVANLIPSSMQKVSNYGYGNESWGQADENVDLKASSYISNVRERFNFDRVDSTTGN